MKVRDLIRELQMYDPNLDILVEDIGIGSYDNDVGGVYQGFDQKGKERVFIQID